MTEHAPMTGEHPPCPTCPQQPQRRSFLMMVSGALGGIAGMLIAIPLVGYLLGAMIRPRPGKWVDLGPLEQFQENQTQLATFNMPNKAPWDGMTAKTACYIKRETGEDFTVFAVNCTHLGCPVSWFPPSGLFMCPCHGGVYNGNGDRVSGPPPRGLYTYPLQIKEGRLQIFASHLPTLQDTLKKGG